MRKIMSIALKAVFAVMLFSKGVYASEIDILLDKLVEKNVLDGYEAQEIRIGTQEEVKKEISRGEHKTLPMWLQMVTISGDVRLRYQYSDNENLAYTRQRGRYRLRLFVNGKINEKVFTGFGFASGENSDPRSTNQTFKDNFGKKNVYIDYVYAEYYPYEWLSIMGGRNKNPIWMTNDMLWDADINPEGFNLKAEAAPNSATKLSTLGGFFILNEIANSYKDPYVLYIQQTLSHRNDANTFAFKSGVTYYDFRNIKDNSTLNYRPSITDGYQQSNSVSGGKYQKNYRVANIDVELKYNLVDPVSLPLVNRSINHIGFFSSYNLNTAIGNARNGWIVGFRFGQEKVEDAGEFQFVYSYRKLEADSWLDTYPDSDFYGGSTNVKGNKFTLTTGILRAFALNFNYFISKPVKGTLKKEKLFQADVNLKF